MASLQTSNGATNITLDGFEGDAIDKPCNMCQACAAVVRNRPCATGLSVTSAPGHAKWTDVRSDCSHFEANPVEQIRSPGCVKMTLIQIMNAAIRIIEENFDVMANKRAVLRTPGLTFFRVGPSTLIKALQAPLQVVIPVGQWHARMGQASTGDPEQTRRGLFLQKDSPKGWPMGLRCQAHFRQNHQHHVRNNETACKSLIYMQNLPC